MTSYCIQDNYPDQYCHCYGCGKNNQYGLKIRSFWDGQKATARFRPDSWHIALPGYVYGGLIASLVDCHGIATASAAMAEADGHDQKQLMRYVTASLHVDYHRPTPMGETLTITGTALKAEKSRVTVDVEIFARGKLRARGRVVAAPIPRSMS